MSEGALLSADRFAPITSALGFVRAPLDMVVAGLADWRKTIHGSVRTTRCNGNLAELLPLLEPLTGGVRPRELAVATANPGWTALFDCGFPEADPSSTVGHMTRTLGVEGVVVVSIPGASNSRSFPTKFGARQFELYGSSRTEFLNYVRTISVTQDGARWRFDAAGEVQPFEDESAYKQRRIADRLTAEMLVQYAAALGLRPFDESFYGPEAVLVTNPAQPPRQDLVLSLSEAQQRLQIAALE